MTWRTKVFDESQIVVLDGNELVCVCTGEKRVAYADLIARAPEMAEEIEKLIAVLLRICACRFDGGTLVEECAWHACYRTGTDGHGVPLGVLEKPIPYDAVPPIDVLREQRDALVEACKSYHDLLTDAQMLDVNNLSSAIAAVRGRLQATIAKAEGTE